MEEFIKLTALAKHLKKDITIYDLETTSFVSSPNFAIVEIALLNITQEGKIEKKSSLINPLMPIPKEASDIHHITDDMVKNAPTFSKFVPYLHQLFQKNLVIGYNNLEFDNLGIAKEFTTEYKTEVNCKDVFLHSIDVRTLYMMDTQCAFGLKGKLEEAVKHYQIALEGVAHRAAYDVLMTAHIIENLIVEKGQDFILQKNASLTPKDFYAQYTRENPSAIQLKPEEQKLLDFIIASSGFISQEKMRTYMKLDDYKLSFLLSTLINKNYTEIANKIADESVQNFLDNVLLEARSHIWGQQTDGKLKPLFDFIKKQIPSPNFDYTQLRLGLRKLYLQENTKNSLIKNKP